jgi:predicted MFS family arabinose efflux permease
VRRLDSLRLAAFRHLAAAYVINEFGTWIGDVALAILVFDRTRSPLATALLFVALRFAPGLAAPLLTTRLEVISPRQILAVLYLAEALIFGILALLAKRFSLPIVLVLAALDGILAVAAKSLIRSVNAAVLGKAHLLREGIGIINLGVTIGGAVGPALAGVLVGTEGPGAALGVDAATFAAVAIIIATTSGLRLPSDLTHGAFGRLKSGTLQAWRRPPVRRVLVGTAVTLLFGSAVIPIEVVFAKSTLQAGDSGYGLLLAAWGLGSVAGGLGATAAKELRLSLAIGIATAFMGCGYAGLAASPDLAAASVFSVFGGIGNGVWVTALLAALQTGTPETSQAAVMSLFEGINQIMPGIGYILGGLITDLGSARIAYAVAAAGILAVLVGQIARPITGVEIRPAERPVEQPD